MVKVFYQDVYIDVDVLIAILAHYETKLLDYMVIWGIKLKLIMCGAAYVILFGGSLGGGGVLLTKGHKLV